MYFEREHCDKWSAINWQGYRFTITHKILPVIITVLFAYPCFGQTEYTRTKEFGTIHINFEAYKELITTIKYYTDESEKEIDSVPDVWVNATFRKGGEMIGITSYEGILNFDSKNNYYNNVYFYYGSKNTAISVVEINLNSGTRRIKVEGANEKKVEALYRAIDAQLVAHLTPINSGTLAIPLVILSCIYLFVGYIYLGVKVAPFTRRMNEKTAAILLLSFLIFLCLSAYSATWIPEFILSPTKENFWDRPSSIIGFISSLLGIGSFMVAFFSWGRKKLNKIGSDTPSQKSQKIE